MIRRALATDIPQIAPLLDQYRQFYRQSSDLAAATSFLQERFARDESVIFVAEDERGPVGFTQLYPSFSSVGLRRSWILNDLFVAPSARKGGHGEALLQAAVAFSKDSGARNLMLQTAVTNETAQRLYERLGWRRDEKYYTYYFFH